MTYHAVSDIHILFHMPVSPSLPLKGKKPTNQPPTTNKTYIGSQGGTLVITIGNLPPLIIFLLLICSYVWIASETNVRGHERRVILITLVLA